MGLSAAFAVRAAWSQRVLPVVGPATDLLPVSSTLATQRGCRTARPNSAGLSPEWVSVQSADTPAIAEGVVRQSHVATNDAPNSHLGHDQNFVVALDSAYNHLNSDANDVENNERLMEMEWDMTFFPPQFWPTPGDRVWMMGRWVFDCGHPEGYHTEFHPPLAVAFTHLEPTTLPGDTAPTLTNRCSIYIGGRGGNFDAPVAIRNYDFDMPLPPRPAPALLSSLHAAVVALPFGGPAPVLTFPGATANTLHVHYPLAAINNPSPNLKFGAVIAAGWRSTVVVAQPTLRVLRVTLDNIRVNNDHDPDFLFVNNPGEYRLWVRVGSQWTEITGLGAVNDGDTVAINKSITLTVPDSGSVPLGLQTTGWEDDCDSHFGPTIRAPSAGDLGVRGERE